MMAPIFFFGLLEAKIMLSATIIGFIIGAFLYNAQGMTKLMGLMHTPWLIAVYFLIRSLSTTSMDETFGIWIRVALLLTSLSLILDIRDVVKYVMGDREPSV